MSQGAYEDYMTELVTGKAPPSLAEVITQNYTSGQTISPQEAAYVNAQGGQVAAGQLPIKQAGFPLAIPGIAALTTGISGLIPALAGFAGLLGGGIAGAQALGLGEGGGLFGNNLLGGDDFTLGGVEFGGPGLSEPTAKQVIKEWHVKYDWGTLQYYLVQVSERSRKIFMYNTRTKKWKYWTWRTPHIAVIGKNMPSHKQITRLRRNLSRHKADARTILKLADPTGYAKSLGYRNYKKRR